MSAPIISAPVYPQPGSAQANFPGINTASPGIAAPYPQQTLAVQQYMPLAQRHMVTPEDQNAIGQGLSRWYPKIMPGYSTPLPQMLADPSKKGLLVGGITGLFTALFVGIGRLGALAGVMAGTAVGGIAGIVSYFSTRQRNDNILDMMARLPAGATRRDMLSDPVVQSERNQAAMASGGGGFGGDLLTAALISNAFSSGGSYRGGYRGSSRR